MVKNQEINLLGYIATAVEGIIVVSTRKYLILISSAHDALIEPIRDVRKLVRYLSLSRPLEGVEFDRERRFLPILSVLPTIHIPPV
jgi:hypothetical protein